MSFNALEASRAKGKPVSLYFFLYGDTPDAYLAYTNSEQPVVHQFSVEIGEVEFVPIPIARGANVASGSPDKSSIEIRMPHDTELALLFRTQAPSQVVVVTVFQGHVADLDFKVAWSGRVLGCDLPGNEAVFSCEPLSRSLRNPGLRRNWQYGCPHVLYGSRCKADKEAATIVVGVVSVAGALVSVNPAWAASEMRPKYIGGEARWTRSDGRTEIRSIIRLADSDTLVLSGLALGLLDGASISLALGCDHIWNSDCTLLHNNVHNFGGQPFIPTKNPVGIKNNFY